MAYNTSINKIDLFMLNRIIHFLFCLLIMCPIAAQTTGKISGRIVSAKDDKKLVGANVVILSTEDGTSTDIDGYFNIINVLPGTYSLKIMMIGYESVVVKDVRVSVNRTVSLDIKMNEAVLEGQEVVVFATKFSTKKDQTGTIKNISSEQIEMMPVENLGGVVNMQAGVVAGHFRGGRSDEVSYLIDGVAVNDVFGGVVAVSTPEVETVQDLEVITGTFNAEYGRAMSGVVNQISKEGSNDIKLSSSYFYANYLSDNNHIFSGIDELSLNQNLDQRFQISGPIMKDKILFFLNYRKETKNNYLNGFDYFTPTDSSSFISNNKSEWYSEHTGDHVFENYCADITGNTVLDNNSLPVSSDNCINYATCEILVAGCFIDAGIEIFYNGNVIFEKALCNENGGYISYNEKSFYVNASGYPQTCSEAEGMYESTPGYISTREISATWRLENDALVPMNGSVNTSFLGKFTIRPFPNFKLNLLYSQNDDKWKEYSHGHKYNPDGLPKVSNISSVKLT